MTRMAKEMYQNEKGTCGAFIACRSIVLLIQLVVLCRFRLHLADVLVAYAWIEMRAKKGAHA